MKTLKEEMRVRLGCIVAAACLAISGCGPDDGGSTGGSTGGGFGNNSGTTPDPGGGTTAVADTAAEDEDAGPGGDAAGPGADASAPLKPSVAIEINLLDMFPGLGFGAGSPDARVLCGSLSGADKAIIARTKDIGDRVPRLAIEKGADLIVLPIAPSVLSFEDPPEEGYTYWQFAFDNGPLEVPAEGLPSKDGSTRVTRRTRPNSRRSS